MKERDLIHKATLELSHDGFTFWKPPKVKYYTETDIFGAFDLVAVRPLPHEMIILWIQVTTKTNLSHRRKKIQEFYARIGGRMKGCQVWAYDENKKSFIREEII